nr:MAG TPA: hypothetical protein [Caudoviricetes sp.]
MPMRGRSALLTLREYLAASRGKTLSNACQSI